jgi:integrase/recombinase XerC
MASNAALRAVPDCSRPSQPGLTGPDAQAVTGHLAWLRQRGRTENTIYQRRRALIRLAGSLPVPLLDATPAQLADWRAGMALSDQGIICLVSHARQFYAWTVDYGLAETNPAARLPVPQLGRRLPRPIGEDPLMSALACAPPRIRPWLVLAGWAGLRAKEISMLRRENVLNTARPPVLIIGKDATKGRRERVIPMSPFVRAELAPLLPGSGWVFPRLDGRPGPNAPGLVSRRCNDHLHDCGITETLHQLRHRFGTGTYHVVRDLRVVQELLGHSSPVSTAGYAAFDNADAMAAVEGLPVPGQPGTAAPVVPA